MFHWTEQKIRVHVFYCVLALAIAHLMRRQAAQAGLDPFVRELLHTLAGIGETVLIYPSTGGRPRARRMLTEQDPTHQRLFDLFDLGTYVPVLRSYTPVHQKQPSTRTNQPGDHESQETRASGGDAGTSCLVLGGILVPGCWLGNTAYDDAGQIAAEGQTESAVQTRLGLDLSALHDLCAGLLAQVPRRKIRVPGGWR